MSFLQRYSKAIDVAGGGDVTVDDEIQHQTFYDFNIVAYPIAAFTGSVEFYIGDILAATVTYVAEKKLAVFTPLSPQYPDIFPATAIGSSDEFRSGVPGNELRTSVKVINTGGSMAPFKVHFMRKVGV